MPEFDPSKSVELTDEEARTIILNLVHQGDLSEEEMRRQFNTVAQWVQETKFNFNSVQLMFRGLINVSVDANGELKFRASDEGLKQARRLPND